MAVQQQQPDGNTAAMGHNESSCDAWPEVVASAVSDKCLHVATTTWARDSHELFDYEARHVTRRSYLMRRAARVLRSATEVEVILERLGSPSSSSESKDHLVTVRHEEGTSPGEFVVLPAERSPIPTTPGSPSQPITKKLWLIVKDLINGRHKLTEGDTIKLGRYKLRVKQLGSSPDTILNLKWEDNEPPERFVTPEAAATKQCRICLTDGGSEQDPLVCPCNCRGSIEFVHVECLRRWVRGKLGVAEENQGQKVATFLRQIYCELCKSPFPSTVSINRQKVPVVPLPPTDAPFVVLEHVTTPNQPNKGIHILCLNSRKEVKLGRGHESDVRIADVSISRYHATIRYATEGEQSYFFLEDHGSKFGTLVSLRRPVPVDHIRPLSVQVGRTVLNFTVVDPPFEFNDLVEMRHENSSLADDDDTTNHNTPGGIGQNDGQIGTDPIMAANSNNVLYNNTESTPVIRQGGWTTAPVVATATAAAAPDPPSRLGGVLTEVSLTLANALGLRQDGNVIQQRSDSPQRTGGLTGTPTHGTLQQTNSNVQQTTNRHTRQQQQNTSM